MKHPSAIALVLVLSMVASIGNALSNWGLDTRPRGKKAVPLFSVPASSSTTTTTRRSFFGRFSATASAAALATTLPTISAANALDMEAFASKELADSSCDDRVSKKCMPKLSDDEALCRFGSPSTKTGEACLRAGMSTSRPTGVDAFGTVDRGDYQRCKLKVCLWYRPCHVSDGA